MQSPRNASIPVCQIALVNTVVMMVAVDNVEHVQPGKPVALNSSVQREEEEATAAEMLAVAEKLGTSLAIFQAASFAADRRLSGWREML